MRFSQNPRTFASPPATVAIFAKLGLFRTSSGWLAFWARNAVQSPRRDVVGATPGPVREASGTDVATVTCEAHQSAGLLGAGSRSGVGSTPVLAATATPATAKAAARAAPLTVNNRAQTCR